MWRLLDVGFFFAFSSPTASASGAKARDFRWLSERIISIDQILPDVPSPYHCCLLIDNEVVLKGALPDYFLKSCTGCH